ncbi:hypothetical protein ACIBCN_15785 [Nocardia sp. NPDC051052]|uniref:hypothetical protein n=1 Tax=Nocardia sp. NPDC051052 TaxID=3364322 RepID=UPI00378B1BD0
MIELAIDSSSRAEDGAYLALADAAAAALDSWAVVGGHMVNLHVLRSGVSIPLRATRDADLAVELLTIRDGVLLDRSRGISRLSPTRSGSRRVTPKTSGGCWNAGMRIARPGPTEPLSPMPGTVAGALRQARTRATEVDREPSAHPCAGSGTGCSTARLTTRLVCYAEPAENYFFAARRS